MRSTVLISDESKAIVALLQQAEQEDKMLMKLQDECRELRVSYEAALTEIAIRMNNIERRKAELEEAAIAIYYGRKK